VKRALRLVEAYAAKRPAETLRWNWDDAIWLYGLTKLRDARWDAYVARFHASAREKDINAFDI
jgi:hypothetical protein